MQKRPTRSVYKPLSDGQKRSRELGMVAWKVAGVIANLKSMKRTAYGQNALSAVNLIYLETVDSCLEIVLRDVKRRRKL